MSNTSQNSNGVGFVGLLTIVFIALKLTDVIDWSWFWVLSPMIFSLVLAFALTGYLVYREFK